MVLTLGIRAVEHYPTFVTIRSSAITIRTHAEPGRSLDALWQVHANRGRAQEPGLASKTPPRGREIGADMGLMDDAKDTAEATGKKVGEWADDTKERVSDKVDEMQADADVKKAEAHRDAVDAKNEYKEDLRNT
jgi:hypothetical protein